MLFLKMIVAVIIVFSQNYTYSSDGNTQYAIISNQQFLPDNSTSILTLDYLKVHATTQKVWFYRQQSVEPLLLAWFEINNEASNIHQLEIYTNNREKTDSRNFIIKDILNPKDYALIQMPHHFIVKVAITLTAFLNASQCSWSHNNLFAFTQQSLQNSIKNTQSILSSQVTFVPNSPLIPNNSQNSLINFSDIALSNNSINNSISPNNIISSFATPLINSSSNQGRQRPSLSQSNSIISSENNEVDKTPTAPSILSRMRKTLARDDEALRAQHFSLPIDLEYNKKMIRLKKVNTNSIIASLEINQKIKN